MSRAALIKQVMESHHLPIKATLGLYHAAALIQAADKRSGTSEAGPGRWWDELLHGTRLDQRTVFHQP